MKVTELESKVLLAIAGSEYGDRPTDPTWVDSLRPAGMTPKQVPGVMASLVRKGLAATDGDACYATVAGLAAIGVDPKGPKPAPGAVSEEAPPAVHDEAPKRKPGRKVGQTIKEADEVLVPFSTRLPAWVVELLNAEPVGARTMARNIVTAHYARGRKSQPTKSRPWDNAASSTT